MMSSIGKERYEQDINDACKEVAKLLPNVLIRFQGPDDEEPQFWLVVQTPYYMIEGPYRGSGETGYRLVVPVFDLRMTRLRELKSTFPMQHPRQAALVWAETFLSLGEILNVDEELEKMESEDVDDFG